MDKSSRVELHKKPDNVNMRTWIRKPGGKLIILISLILLPFIVIAYFGIRMSFENGEFSIEHFWALLLGSSIFLIAWYTTVPRLFKDKRIPKKISLEMDAGEINVEINPEKVFSFSRRSLAYCFYKYELYCVLVVYKLTLSRRGHFVYQEFFSITASKLPIGWTKDQVFEIVASFQELGVEFHDVEDKGFLARLLE